MLILNTSTFGVNTIHFFIIEGHELELTLCDTHLRVAETFECSVNAASRVHIAAVLNAVR